MIDKAVVDRFEEDQAVLVAGNEERKLVVPRQNLTPGAKEGYWLMVDLDGKSLVSAVIDEKETAKVKQRIAEKLERLRRGELMQ
jgi:hypothetical protein